MAATASVSSQADVAAVFRKCFVGRCSRRHRPFAIAGAWHRLPLLVRAPHRRLRFESQLAPDKTILAVADPLPPLKAAVEISFRVIDDKTLSSLVATISTDCGFKIPACVTPERVRPKVKSDREERRATQTELSR